MATVTPSAPAPDAALNRAADLIARGRAHDAMATLTQLLRIDPRHAQARTALAALQAERGQRDAALVTLREGAAIDPSRFAAPAALLQAELGDLSGALSTLAAVPPAARNGRHYALVGGLALRANAAQVARDAYAHAVAAPQAEPVWWVGLALAHEALGQLAEARRAFSQAAAAPALPADVRAFVAQRIAALPAAAPADALAQQQP
jgi:tetratricopeptide (TPR) repeat protein